MQKLQVAAHEFPLFRCQCPSSRFVAAPCAQGVGVNPGFMAGQAARAGTDALTLPIRIGTRPSRLALAQGEEIRAALVSRPGWSQDAVQIVPIATRGDRMRDRAVADIGGKAVFVSELEQALADGRIDLAVHSAKDMPARMDDHLCLAAVPPRAAPFDVWVGTPVAPPGGARGRLQIGTGSPRRAALLRRYMPDFEVVGLRGNVDTRIAMVDRGTLDAVILAEAGLGRLGLSDRIAKRLPPGEFVPAGGQGCLAVQARRADTALIEALAGINDPDSARALNVERAFLDAIGGDCHSAVGVFARVEHGMARFDAIILSGDGREWKSERLQGACDQLEALGQRATSLIAPHAARLLHGARS